MISLIIQCDPASSPFGLVLIVVMSSSPGILSQTLQSITNTKIDELREQRANWEAQKRKTLEAANDTTDQTARLRALLSGFIGLSTTTKLDEVDDYELTKETIGGVSLANIRSFLDQSQYDPSIPKSLQEEWERKVRLSMDQKSRKLEYADLYSRLLTEWLSDTSSVATPPADATSDSASLDGDFEVVAQTKLQQLRELFESYVFQERDVDVDAINQHLDGLFRDERAARQLKTFRENMKMVGDRLISSSAPFDTRTLQWSIKGLIKNELLTEQKKTLLQEFLQNEVILTEIADVLNMRYASLQTWSWGTSGVPVEPRRQLNGKYRVMMDEDVLQAIFLQYIGIQWSISTKNMLKDLMSHKDIWKSPHKPLPSHEQRRRQYFLGDSDSDVTQGIAFQKQEGYWNDYFLAQLPSTLRAGARISYDDEDNDEEDENVKSPLKIRQQLLHQIATELLIHRSIHGEVAVVKSDLQWFYTSLSHKTIFAVLRYFGMPEAWMSFFKAFLETPLHMVYEGEQDSEVRTRKRGVPIAHAISNWMAEVVLFVVDMTVNQEADGTLLYRLTDDFFVWGDPARCKAAWKAISRTVKILGLDINEKKSGSVCLGGQGTSDIDSLPKGDVTWAFLKLDPNTKRWVIDQNQVDRHTSQLKRQLYPSQSIFSFVQTWNSCVGRFFKRVFGEPANCFGQGHVEMILETHRRIQGQLFDHNSDGCDSVTDYLKKRIAEKFNMTDVPDAFFYLPEDLGGLGLCNPFIEYLSVQKGLIKSPEEQMEKFFETEKEDYQRARDHFEAHGGYAIDPKSSVPKRTRQPKRSAELLSVKTTDSKDPNESTKISEKDHDQFFSMAEYTQYRELTSWYLQTVYSTLHATASPRLLDGTSEVHAAVLRLPYPQSGEITENPDKTAFWLINLYASDLIRRFGGLAIVDKALLPLGVMQILRSKKVIWQEVL